ncbi:STAS domain-containing protein [uncultured Jatrophihabitans sp.]|uniref:STAS domain-containing protein n=1 Tax=uncultured Jatrophihabitans sp. TaxID=1610747 RepID=UPI0035CC3641
MTTFELDQTREPITVIRPIGRLNMAAAPQLSTAVAGAVKDGQSRVVVDLSATEFIDSSGLGALVASLKRCRQAGGNLRVAAANPQVVTALELTNLNRVFAPSETVDDACAQV